MGREPERRGVLKIELLYFEGCPSWSHVVRNLDELAAEGMPLQIRLVSVSSPEEAERTGFAGSPTLRVEGSDLFDRHGDGRPAFGCRIYETPDGPRGWPTKTQIAEALRRSTRVE